MIEVVQPDSHRTAAHTFRDVASQGPQRAAVRHRAIQLTYGQLARRAGGLAEELRDLGVGRGDIVATLLNRSELVPVAVLGIWAVGAAYVHIEPTDPDRRVVAQLTVAKPSVILTDSVNQARMRGLEPPSISMSTAAVEAVYEVDEGVRHWDLAYLVSTSGSTGPPKMVEVDHRALLNFHAGFGELNWQTESITSYGVTTTFAADIGKASIYGALLSGARLDVLDRETTLNPHRFAQEMRSHPVEAVTITPSLLEALASQCDLSALLPQRLVIFIGEPLPPRLVGAIFDAAPRIEVINGYGPAEATIFATAHRVRPSDAKRSRTPVGRLLPGVTALVLDDGGARVPHGTAGVLYLGGVCLARGYRGDPDKAAQRFVMIEGHRFYRTDDLVSGPVDGCLEFLGRVDDQLKIRGTRVEPSEVEKALLEVPGVRLAVVTGERSHPHSPLELAAYVVGTADKAEITRWLSDRLPAQLIPSRLRLVVDITVNMNGKADFQAMREVSEESAVSVPSRERPVSAVEKFVAGVWQDVLETSDIGRHEKFVEIGGTSFKALSIYGRLRRQFPDFSIAQLYAHPTIASLAESLGNPGDESPAARSVVEL